MSALDCHVYVMVISQVFIVGVITVEVEVCLCNLIHRKEHFSKYHV